MKALSFGEVLWDIYPTEKFIGGAPFNFAGHLGLQNNESYLVSSVGNDPLAEDTLQAVNKLNVKTDYIGRVDAKETGNCMVTLDENSIPSYDLKNDVAYDYIDTKDIDASHFDAVYYGTLSLRGAYNRKSLENLLNTANDTLKFCDLNIRPPYFSKEVIRFCIEHADIIKVSNEELPTVLTAGYGKEFSGVEESAKFIAEKAKNLKIIIITLGPKGSAAYSCAEDKFHYCGAGDTKVVSTVGAGDSFSASFLSEYHKGKPIPDCLGFASKVGDFVVSRTEAVPYYDIRQFI